MTPGAPDSASSESGSVLARVIALAALLAGVALVVVVLFGDGGGRQYKLIFETGGQLVPGNEVLVAGQKVGNIDSLELTDDGLAEVSINTEDPLPMGSTAQIRATSLSGIANRYISVQPGPSDEDIPDGATIEADSTASPVDIDQLFSIFDEDTRKSLQNVFEGQAAVYAGDPAASRKAYRYLAPGIQSTQRFLAQLTKDQDVLSEFLASGANVLGAVAERRDDLSELTENANVALTAIADESESLDRVLGALPPTMRQANTTFVNLRAALDDVDQLVDTAKPATVDFAEFLRDVRPVTREAVPVVNDLADVVKTEGPNNDLTEVLQQLPALEERAAAASTSGIDAIDVSQTNVEVTRQYSPDLMALVSRLGQVLGYYSGDGHYARTMPVLDIFAYDDATNELNPTFTDPASQYDFYTGPFFDSDGYQRCPGTASQPAQDGSTPFDEGFTAPDDCDPADVIPEDTLTP